MKHISLIMLITTILISCKSYQSNKPLVAVSILPQRYFVKKIADDNFKVTVLIPPGASPASYEPTPNQLIDLSNSILYFRIGHIAFEKTWIDKISSSNKKMKIIDTSIGVDFIKDDHHHSGTSIVDPHIWLSPKEVKVQLGHILRELIAIDKKNEDQYLKNYNNFLWEINELDREIKNIFKKSSKKEIMVYHPAWNYFTNNYGLILLPIEYEGKTLSPKRLKNIIAFAKEKEIGYIFVQSQFDTKSTEVIANEIGAAVVRLDPLKEDWINNMKEITRSFAGSLK